MNFFRDKTIKPILSATTTSQTMKEKADTWQMELANIAWEYEQTLKNCSLADLNHKPGPASWSVAEIISHLILVNSSYFPIFEKLLQQKYKAPLAGKIPGLGQKVGGFILNSMRKPKKVKTFDKWQPPIKLYDSSILDRFYDQQHELSTYVQRLEPLLEKGIMISSPVNKWVIYSLDQAIEIILVHEKRHLEQIKQRLNQKPSPHAE